MSVGPRWGRRWLGVAEQFATFSKDPKAQVGAVLVNDRKRMPGYGYNGLPEHIRDTPEILNNADLKNRLVVHAEINALLNCSESTAGLHLFVTRQPCSQCAPLIIQAGIRQIHYYETLPDVSKNRLECEKRAREAFALAGVVLLPYVRT